MPNQTSGDGGGIWAGAGVSMTASTVDGNQAGTDGGGLFVNDGDVTMASGSSVSGNTALNGTAGGLSWRTATRPSREAASTTTGP